MNGLHILSFVLLAAIVSAVAFQTTGCGVYRFRDISIPDSIRTVKVNFIENRAPYVNPQLSPLLTDRVRQKIVSQTRLSQTNNDNADWIVGGTITNYSVSTSGISQQQEATNRLTVAVRIVLNDQKANRTREYDISRNFEFKASLSLQQAESQLGDEIVRGLSEDIFNRLFSDW